jgi:hypothetical protein
MKRSRRAVVLAVAALAVAFASVASRPARSKLEVTYYYLPG